MPERVTAADQPFGVSRGSACVALALAVLLPLTSLQAARADSGEAVATVDEVAAAVGAATDALPAPAAAEIEFVEGAEQPTAVADGSSVTVAGGEVVIAAPGAAPITITLPESVPADPVVASDGSVVLSDEGADVAASVGVYADGSVSVRTVVADDGAPSTFDYQLGLPEGAALETRADGGVDVVVTVDVPATAPLSPTEAAVLLPPAEDVVVGELVPTEGLTDAGSAVPTVEELQSVTTSATTAEVVMAHLPAPWAVDAAGTELPTEYVVDGDQLTQVVDTKGAQFPVVADPFFVPMVWLGLGAAARVLAPTALRAFAATTIRSGAYITRGGYSSFSAFKRAHGTQPGYQWHHIVEQRHVGRFVPQAIHNPNNLVAIPSRVHQACINRWMASKNVRLFGLSTGSQTMRTVVGSRSFSQQHAIGLQLLRYCGVRI